MKVCLEFFLVYVFYRQNLLLEEGESGLEFFIFLADEFFVVALGL